MGSGFLKLVTLSSILFVRVRIVKMRMKTRMKDDLSREFIKTLIERIFQAEAIAVSSHPPILSRPTRKRFFLFGARAG